MAVPETLQRLKLGQFAGMHRSQMIPLGTRACYFCASSTLSEEELQEYLTEPVSALPPAVSSHLPKLEIFLVPYLERGAEATGRAKAMAPEPVVAENKPDEDRSLASGFMVTENEATLAFAVKDAEVADYHYRFYRTIAELVAGKKGENVPPDYAKLISEELEHNAHGEVDEESWRLKMELTPQDRTATRVSTRFRAYLRRSFIGTETTGQPPAPQTSPAVPGPLSSTGRLRRPARRSADHDTSGAGLQASDQLTPSLGDVALWPAPTS
jgi:hypothetical protein